MTLPTTCETAADRDAVATYLVSREVLDNADRVEEIRRLTGGVSGSVLLVEAGDQRVVVKTALDRLAVDDEWLAAPGRAVTEARAIELLHPVTPEQTPELLDIDPDRFTLTMTAAPAPWITWKEQLLGDAWDLAGSMATALILGNVLGSWHASTRAEIDRLDHHFGDHEALEDLRVRPFHRHVAERHPERADVLSTCIDDLHGRRDCLVHGDFSPKNVMVGTDGVMVLDYEVAHVGAAVFDLAFLTCHLMLKAARSRSRARDLRLVNAAFLRGYEHEIGSTPWPRLAWHTAALLLARVDGVSRVDYLSNEAEDGVRRVALTALGEDPDDLEQLWDRVEGVRA